jgi:hypothetical protein
MLLAIASRVYAVLQAYQVAVAHRNPAPHRGVVGTEDSALGPVLFYQAADRFKTAVDRFTALFTAARLMALDKMTPTLRDPKLKKTKEEHITRLTAYFLFTTFNERLEDLQEGMNTQNVAGQILAAVRDYDLPIRPEAAALLQHWMVRYRQEIPPQLEAEKVVIEVTDSNTAVRLSSTRRDRRSRLTRSLPGEPVSPLGDHMSKSAMMNVRASRRAVVRRVRSATRHRLVASSNSRLLRKTSGAAKRRRTQRDHELKEARRQSPRLQSPPLASSISNGTSATTPTVDNRQALLAIEVLIAQNPALAQSDDIRALMHHLKAPDTNTQSHDTAPLHQVVVRKTLTPSASKRVGKPQAIVAQKAKKATSKSNGSRSVKLEPDGASDVARNKDDKSTMPERGTAASDKAPSIWNWWSS